MQQNKYANFREEDMQKLLLALSLVCSLVFAQKQMSFHNRIFKIAQDNDSLEGDTCLAKLITSYDEATLPFLPAIKICPKEQGVGYTYYEGKCEKTAEIASMKQVKKGKLPHFSIATAAAKDHFAYIFKAYIKIETRGVYKFYTYSDDGSRLMIDGTEVVNNDGRHSAKRADGKVGLEAGFHEIELQYFEDNMGETLEVGYASREIPEQVIPNNVLRVRER